MSGGAFQRKDSVWRDKVEKDGRFKPETGDQPSPAGRRANRTLTTLYLKGLEDAIGVSVCHPTWKRTRPEDPEDKHAGWAFASPSDPPFSSPTGLGSFPCTDCIPDTVNHVQYVRDLYDLAQDTGGKYTVPVLWDTKERTIVNNESSDILRMFNADFQDLAQNPTLDLYPEELRPEIDSINDRVYHNINNGVYRCGFAKTQEAYEAAFKDLWEAMDWVEGLLAERRYLAGKVLTEADVRLFMTLIRFDEVYVVYFKTNRDFVKHLPNTADYVRELFSIRAFKSTVSMAHIKTHYFTSHPELNAYSIIPVGPGPWYSEPPTTERHKLAGVSYA